MATNVIVTKATNTQSLRRKAAALAAKTCRPVHLAFAYGHGGVARSAVLFQGRKAPYRAEFTQWDFVRPATTCGKKRGKKR